MFNINLSKAFLLFKSVVIELLLCPRLQAMGNIKKALYLILALRETSRNPDTTIRDYIMKSKHYRS